MNEKQTCLTEDYVAHLVHDLKTPIIAIGGYAQRLRDHKLGDLNDDQQEAVNNIVKLVQRLEHDVSWVLQHARLQRKLNEKSTVERFDLKAHIEETAGTVCAEADPKNLELQTDLPEGPLEVEGDPSMIERAIMELIRNAAKHSPEEGRIQVSLTQKDDWAEVAVTDEGEGLTEDQIDKLFQPWEQVMGIEDRNLRGIGLGLANVRNMAEAHGGDVRVSSSKGKGSRFIIRLPLTQSD